MNPLNQASAHATHSPGAAQLPNSNRTLTDLETGINQASGLLYVLGSAFSEQVREATGPFFTSISHGIEQLTRESAEKLHCLDESGKTGAGALLQIEDNVSEAAALIYLFGTALTKEVNDATFQGAGTIAAGIQDVARNKATALHACFSAAVRAGR